MMSTNTGMISQPSFMTSSNGMSFPTNWRNSADASMNQRYFCAFSPENRYLAGSSLRTLTENLPDGLYRFRKWLLNVDYYAFYGFIHFSYQIQTWFTRPLQMNWWPWTYRLATISVDKGRRHASAQINAFQKRNGAIRWSIASTRAMKLFARVNLAWIRAKFAMAIRIARSAVTKSVVSAVTSSPIRATTMK